MKPIIDLELKNKSFKRGDLCILEDFSLTVEAGEKIAIIGESGVGKTSLLNILGLLDTDYQGNYSLFGSETKEMSSDKLADWRNKKIGFVLQDSALIDSLSVEDNIKLPFLYANLKKNIEATNYFNKVVDRIGISSILKKKPLECSGGQRARAVFARGIIMNPQIILSDEPTASLDSKNKESIVDLLFEMNKESGATIITVTHDLELATLHDRVITIERKT